MKIMRTCRDLAQDLPWAVLALVLCLAMNQPWANAQAAAGDAELPFSYESLSAGEKAAVAQAPAGFPEPVGEAGSAPSGYADGEFLRDQLLLQAGVVILLSVVTLAALTLLLVYLFRTKAAPAQMVNGAGLTLIIFGTVFLAYTVNDKDQLIASVGILGAIAGYLFGTASGRGGTPTSGTDRGS